MVNYIGGLEGRFCTGKEDIICDGKLMQVVQCHSCCGILEDEEGRETRKGQGKEGLGWDHKDGESEGGREGGKEGREGLEHDVQARFGNISFG